MALATTNKSWQKRLGLRDEEVVKFVSRGQLQDSMLDNSYGQIDLRPKLKIKYSKIFGHLAPRL